MIKKNLWLLFLLCIACEDQSLMKHPLDKSQTRTIILDNKMKVYLLSDPDFNVSAASLAVEVGHLDNPDNRLGIAHFLEHMLFLGTEKYPEVDDYKQYLDNNGGMSNAYTSTDLTNYHFQVLPDAFEGAIDRFSQFFISPLFTEEYTAREVNAVNSEFQMYKMNDGRRAYRLSQIFAKEGHPEQKFSVGNLETLGDIDRNELLDFYDKHYSANKMGLVLMSTHSLDVLEGWVRQYFSKVKNNELPEKQYDSEYFERKETFRLIQVEPVKDTRTLELVFSLPGTRSLYTSKPGRQLGFILGHEGQGSLLSYLKNKGWAISLGAYAPQSSKNYGSMNIQIGLTESGLVNYKEVITATMDYIELMKKSGHVKHVFEELKTMAEIDEVYSNKGEGYRRATNIANEVLKYPLKDAGRINYIFSDNTPEAYDNLISYLTPDNLLVTLTAKGLKTDKKEHYFGASYSYTENDSFYLELLKTKFRKEFKIPDQNLFIPKSISVPKRKIDSNVFPEQVESTNGVSMYFGQDHEFLRPKGVIGLKILLPKDKMSLEHRVYSRFYVACVNESLNELSYPAKMAGLNYSLRAGYEGVFLDIGGYKESSIALYELMLDHMTEFSITNKQFESIKDKIIKDYENTALIDAFNQARELAPEMLFKTKYTWEECLDVAKSADLERIKDYQSTLYDKTFLEAMVYGDFDRQDSKKVLSLFKNKTGTRPLNREDAFDIEFLQIQNPEIIQYVDKLKVNNSCLFKMYHIGKDSPETRAMALLASKAIEQPFYTEMRTNQQLGYVVWSYPRLQDDTYYLNFLIQSGDYPADDLDQRADNLIVTLPNLISNMSDESFQQLIDSEVETLERKPLSISERAAKNKTIIFDYDGDFSRNNKTIESLKRVKKDNLAAYMKKVFSKETRKVISVLAFAENHENKSEVQSSFSDLADWKSTRLYK
tara:strand:- start:756 stop:3569 length:2814 start_codon:yes stop_codon:yes gene_type:complete